jgi:hypothetical protein
MTLSVLLSRSPHPVVPCLQALPPDWPATRGDAAEANVKPIVMTQSPEGANFNTYFWQPPKTVTTTHTDRSRGRTKAGGEVHFARNVCFSADPRRSLHRSLTAHKPAETREDWSALQKSSSENTESLGRLFLEFLWQYAFEIDPRTAVVSIDATEDEGASTAVWRPFTKLRSRKVALSHWRSGSTLGIEDPFEQDYDVAHVLRPPVS